MKAFLFSLLVAGTVCIAVACSSSDSGGGGAVGAGCNQSGGADQCASGGVCGKPSDGTTSLQCLVVCKEQIDCPAGQDCNGVDGSLQKGCRPKSIADAGGADTGKK